MRFLRAAGLAGFLLAISGAPLIVAGEDSHEAEIRVQMEIEQARQKVEMCTRLVNQRKAEVEAARIPLEQAHAAHLKSRTARDKADLGISRYQTTLDAATASLNAKIATTRAEYEVARRIHLERPYNSSAENEMIADAYALNSLERRRDAVLARMKAGTRMEGLKSVRDAANEVFWRDYGVYYKAASAYELQTKILEQQMLELARAQETLACLRADAVQKLQASTAPFLETVEATAGGKAVYRAAWVPAVEIVDQRIAFMKEAVAFQRQEIILQTQRRDEWLNRYVEASGEVQTRIHAYEDAIWSQAYKSIAIEIGDAAIAVAMDWNTMGPFAVAYQAVEKCADAAGGIYSGDYNKRYAIPASSGSAPPPYSADSVKEWFEEAGSDRYKNLVKAAVDGAAGGELIALDQYATRSILGRSFTVPSIAQADLWAIVKREAMQGGGEGLVVKRVLNPASTHTAWRSVRNAFRDTSVS